jgi:hypothetical protein
MGTIKLEDALTELEVAGKAEVDAVRQESAAFAYQAGVRAGELLKRVEALEAQLQNGDLEGLLRAWRVMALCTAVVLAQKEHPDWNPHDLYAHSIQQLGGIADGLATELDSGRFEYLVAIAGVLDERVAKTAKAHPPGAVTAARADVQDAERAINEALGEQ